MKYLEIFESFEDTHSLCERYRIKNYSINSDGSVDVSGSVDLFKRVLEKIPINFGRVGGDFDCSYNYLTSLKFSPKEVGGDFIVYDNKLTSLEFCPMEIGGHFWCSDNLLTSLEFCPKVVGRDFSCKNNHLTLLEFCPKEIEGSFDCRENRLKSLEFCPKEVGGWFNCSSNQLEVIDFLPEWIEGDIYLKWNKIRDIKVEDKNYKLHGKCHLDGNPINVLFKHWDENLRKFIEEIDFEDFIKDNGKSVDINKFEFALNGKKYDREEIEEHYKIIERNDLKKLIYKVNEIP